MILMSIALATSLTASESQKPTWYAIDTDINKCVDTRTLKMQFASTPQRLASTFSALGEKTTVKISKFDNNGNPSIVTVTVKWSEGQRTQNFFSNIDLCNEYLSIIMQEKVRRKAIQKPFGDGTYIIGRDILPGTYESSGGFSCYYARLSGFSGSDDDIITNNVGTGRSVVTIAPTDRGFETDGCGTWTLLK